MECFDNNGDPNDQCTVTGRFVAALSAADLMRTAAEALGERGFDGEALSVITRSTDSADGWLRELLAGLPDDELREVVEPAGFVGELRPYQRRALGCVGHARRHPGQALRHLSVRR